MFMLHDAANNASVTHRASSTLSAYPVNPFSYQELSQCKLDAHGVPYQSAFPGYDPLFIAHYALAQWNLHLVNREEKHYTAFMRQVAWFMLHAVRVGTSSCGWPIQPPAPEAGKNCLSAAVQGCVLSVLMRAYQLTNDQMFLTFARCVVQTFLSDILDGGVCAPLGTKGIFFEEIAAYPATHMLNGCIFGLIGLYDYLALVVDDATEQHVQRCFATLQELLPAFDVGYWTRVDLLHHHLSTPEHLALQVELVEAFAKYKASSALSAVAAQWRCYPERSLARFRYHCVARSKALTQRLFQHLQAKLYPRYLASSRACMCISAAEWSTQSTYSWPLSQLSSTLGDLWDIEYLVQQGESENDRHTIHHFGWQGTTPWHFPSVCLYVLLGLRKQLALMRRSNRFSVLLSLDSIFTGAFASLAGRITGTRTVCLDQGSIRCLTTRYGREYRRKQEKSLQGYIWPVRLVGRWLLCGYWPLLRLLARIAARCGDHFLLPAMDDTSLAELCSALRLSPYRVSCYHEVIDYERYRAGIQTQWLRARLGIAEQTAIVSVSCRLHPKDSPVLVAIKVALNELPAAQREQLHVLIAVEEEALETHYAAELRRLGLERTCVLWRPKKPEDMATLLAVSAIFVCVHARPIEDARLLLEAMAAGCAVVTSEHALLEPDLFSDARGCAISAIDKISIVNALFPLLQDADQRQRMASHAQAYIATNYCANEFKRSLQRVTGWSGLDELVNILHRLETVEVRPARAELPRARKNG